MLTAKATFGDELKPTVRDPRLCQTVCMPGSDSSSRPRAVTLFHHSMVRGYNKNETGYSMLKHVQIDYKGSLDQEGKGSTPAIQYRYADILLNYAEALAELDGAANASQIITILKPLRDRVGMPEVDFDREYNTEADYPSAISISICRLFAVNVVLSRLVRVVDWMISSVGQQPMSLSLASVHTVFYSWVATSNIMQSMAQASFMTSQKAIISTSLASLAMHNVTYCQ